MVVEVDLIVRGTIDNVLQLDRDKEIRVQVAETLRGAHVDSLTFVTYTSTDLKANGGQQLFFLSYVPASSLRGESRDHFLTRSPWVCHQVFDLDEDTTFPSFDERGLLDLRGGEAVLCAIRKYVTHMKKDPPIRQVELMEDDDPNALYGLNPTVVVPLDRRLWSFAAQWEKEEGLAATNAKKVKETVVEFSEYKEATAQHALGYQAPTARRWAANLRADSLETMATDCDLILCGTIVDHTLVQLGRNTRENYESTLDMHFVKLRVTESIKGTAGETISFYIENGGPLGKWQDKETSVVVFLKDRYFQDSAEGKPLGIKVYGQLSNVLRYSARRAGVHGLIAMEKPHPKMYSANLQWLDDPHQMLRVIRQYLKDVPAARKPGVRANERGWGSLERMRKIRLFDFKPRTLLADTRWENSRSRPYVRMNFPVDENLEKHALQWIKSKDKVHRLLGAYALIYFKSENSAEALKSLLDDPGLWGKPQPVSVGGYHDRFESGYIVRTEAWHILHAWGYDVEKPAFND